MASCRPAKQPAGKPRRRPRINSVKTSDFDYHLPSELIAQEPPPQRDTSRLLLLDRANSGMTHHSFRDLPGLLRKDDLLVFNDTKVLPARLIGKKVPGGGKAELLLLEELSTNRWRALASAKSKIRVGDRIQFGVAQVSMPLCATLVFFDDAEGVFTIEFSGIANIRGALDQLGLPPLPPYIGRAPTSADIERYQTIYARSEGAVAAPTAGLHFTPDVFAALDQRGIERAFVTLHVGLGTFRPVKTEQIEDHRIHSERFEIPSDTIAAIVRAKSEHRRIVAVGTTVVRALESSSNQLSSASTLQPCNASTNIFIHPPYQFRFVDALLTNFHLPRSTLLMLVSAFAGREFVLDAYRAAIAERYRFYSYGDCMLIT